MLLGRAEGEATRVGALVVALEQEEITMNEFSDGVGSLTPEAILVTSMLLRSWMDLEHEEQGRLMPALLLCRQMASETRGLS